MCDKVRATHYTCRTFDVYNLGRRYVSCKRTSAAKGGQAAINMCNVSP